MNDKLRIIFFGTPNFVLSVLAFLHQSFNLVAVVTTPDQVVGRHQILTPSAIKQSALDKNIPVFTPKILDNEFVQKLKNIQPDLIIVASYGKIIPQEVLDIPRLGAINIHPSFLPKYRGATPIQTSILNGEKTTGVTIIKMDAQVDHGPILSQEEFPITRDANFNTQVNSLFSQSLTLLPEAIENLKNNKMTLQDHSQATFTKLIKKEDGYFDLPDGSQELISLEKLDRMIRAYYPWPNAWTKWNGKIIKFLPDNLIQIEGKKAVKLEDFLNGYPNFPLKNFK